MRGSHQFSRVPSVQIPRSSFQRDHGHKTSFSSGYLVPIYVDEALPGDTFSVNMTGFVRLATPLAPFLDNLYINSFFFAVPVRLLWENWQRMNGEQDSPGDSTDFLVPQVVAGSSGFTAGSISDYFGLPVDVPNLAVSALWHRAYNYIWNDWFRDQNLQDPVGVPLDDGPDADTEYTLLRRGKRHDYFTSALPWPQKGESVTLPLGLQAPLVGYDHGPGLGIPSFSPSGDLSQYNRLAMSSGSGSATWDGVPVAGGIAAFGLASGVADAAGERATGLRVDLSQATAATINQLRQAFQLQRLYERDARGGSRYTEILRSHFGVISPDARLQRPEYLGGGQSPVNIHTVEQTAEGTAPVGSLGAFGTSVMSRHGFSRSFTEHCVLLGLISVRADLSYQQGLNRMWSRRGRFDFYWPALAHLGEQAVLSKEIYCDGSADDETVWGYQERFAEYRYKPSIVTGELRSSFPQSLDAWHLAQDFATRPALNSGFIAENPPVERVLAVQTGPQFIGDFWFRQRCVRPMPVYGVPGLIDHF